jgi:type I restriction enzyme S subunit
LRTAATSWHQQRLGDILQLEYGKPLSDQDRDPNGRYPAYGANGEKARTNKYLRDNQSIIVGRKGSAGEINLSEQRYWPLDVTYFTTFDASRHDLRFLFYLLTALNLPKLAKGVKPGLNRNEVYSLPVSVPLLPEQRRIAAVLDDVFERIAIAAVNAEKNLQNAEAVFESHLDAVFANRGAGWEEKRLAEVSLDFGRGKSKHRPRNDPRLYGGRFPFIQTGDVRGADHLITEYSQTYSEAGLAQSKLWPAGTLCITIAANIAETGILGFDACFPDSVIGVVVNPRVTSTKFLEYLLQSVKAKLKAQGKGSAQDNINMGTFENQTFPFPPLTTQERIVATFDGLREETTRLEAIYRQKLDAVDELKKSLLHQAFCGAL